MPLPVDVWIGEYLDLSNEAEATARFRRGEAAFVATLDLAGGQVWSVNDLRQALTLAAFRGVASAAGLI